MTVNLPTPESNPGKAEWGEVYANDKALKDAVDALEGKFPIGNSNLASSAKPLTWYTPKVIATEEARNSTSFGTLTTADEISSVVLPQAGLLFVTYQATAKSSVSGAGRAAIFLGENQLRGGYNSTWNPATHTLGAQEATVTTTEWVSLGSSQGGLVNATANDWESDYTTGQVVGSAASNDGNHGACCIFAAAGTYAISVRFRATSGSITVKNRTLRVWTLGV